MTSPRRTILVFVLALVLVTPWASAAPRADISPRAAFAQLWSFLASLWSDAGCEIDPNGKCAPNLPDAGCEADPSGQCTPDVLDAGCELDPDGRCLPEQDPGPTNGIDAGCEIDPSGRPSCGS